MDTASYERLPSQPAGTVLGESYRLVRRVGFGGMGEVYEATHVRLPGRFAVKILLPDLLSNQEAFARFCREAEIMSELRHPNIVQIFDFNAAPDGRPYFVMEYLDGQDLEARLPPGEALPLTTTVRIVGAVASALAAAHGHGVVHRDLKPANIFLGPVDGQADQLVKVLDFGISQVRARERRLSQPHHVLGTPPYMAPEQIRGTSEAVDGRADQFALGAIAYRMLTGRDAFHGEDTPALLYHIVHETPAPLVALLPGTWDTRPLQGVLDRALAKRPAQRWAGMTEFARAFEDAAERTISDATPLPAPLARPAPISDDPPRPAAPISDDPPPPTAPISDDPPPIRLPDLPPAPRGPAIAPPRQAPAIAAAKRTAPAAPGRRARASSRSASHDAGAWDLPSDVDKVPLTRLRAATFGLVALALGGVLLATGGARQLPEAWPFARDNLRAWLSRPPALDQPRADQTVPVVVERARAKAADEAATQIARDNGTAAPEPPKPAPRGPHGKRKAAPPPRPTATASAPATPAPAPAAPAPAASAETKHAPLAGVPPTPSPLPVPRAPSSPGHELTGPPPGGFSIPAPAEQAPTRDLAPTPDPESSPAPARSNTEAATPTSTPAPRARRDDDDPFPPPRSNTEAPSEPTAP
jgi:serine/threonine-protein kinase